MVRWRASSTEHMSLSDICRASSSKRVSCVSHESASASSLGLKNAARNNRASSSGAISLSAVTRGSASWTDDQASPANARSAGTAMVPHLRKQWRGDLGGCRTFRCITMVSGRSGSQAFSRLVK